MVMDRKDLDFCVKMVKGTHLHTALSSTLVYSSALNNTLTRSSGTVIIPELSNTVL